MRRSNPEDRALQRFWIGVPMAGLALLVANIVVNNDQPKPALQNIAKHQAKVKHPWHPRTRSARAILWPHMGTMPWSIVCEEFGNTRVPPSDHPRHNGMQDCVLEKRT